MLRMCISIDKYISRKNICINLPLLQFRISLASARPLMNEMGYYYYYFQSFISLGKSVSSSFPSLELNIEIPFRSPYTST